MFYFIYLYIFNLQTRLAHIDLFPETENGVRETSLQRYKEKRRNRLFSKKIRYEVRKVNADQRPRMKASVRVITYFYIFIFIFKNIEFVLFF